MTTFAESIQLTQNLIQEYRGLIQDPVTRPEQAEEAARELLSEADIDHVVWAANPDHAAAIVIDRFTQVLGPLIRYNSITRLFSTSSNIREEYSRVGLQPHEVNYIEYELSQKLGVVHDVAIPTSVLNFQAIALLALFEFREKLGIPTEVNFKALKKLVSSASGLCLIPKGIVLVQKPKSLSWHDNFEPSWHDELAFKIKTPTMVTNCWKELK